MSGPAEYDSRYLAGILHFNAGDYFEAPQVVCLLARGPGGAVRRARTRLPGGGRNPVAVVLVPRERMVGANGIGSTVEIPDNDATRGMVRQVRFLVSVEEVPADATSRGTASEPVEEVK